MEQYQSWQSLGAMFFDQAAARGDKPFLWAKRDGAWRALDWAETRARVSALAAGLEGLGVGPGDRVMLVSENRPEWAIGELAIMVAGAITVPAYTTSTAADYRHVLEDSGARLALVSRRGLAERLLEAARDVPGFETLIAIEPPAPGAGPRVLAWDAVAAAGADEAAAAAGARRARRTDTACIIYTSGTGGLPKGVMLSHGAILCNCMGAHALLETLGLEDEVFLSFLPLSHSYEHSAGHFFPMSIGAQIYYAEGAEHLAANMAEVRPTIMTAVPRLYETMHQRISRDVERAGGLKAALFKKTVALGRKRYETGGALALGERVADALVDRLVREKVRARFGGRLKALVSGGGPLNPDIGLFFTALGLRVLQGYGLTESAPIISCNVPGRVKMHTVGPPFPGVEVRIADDGEILVRGELVMQGYWRAAEATAEAIRDGWLHTGDIGRLDEDGYIQITDRKKDIIKNSGGDLIAPQRIEGLLTLQAEIGQAMVHGDRRPHLVALLVPDEAFAHGWADAHDRPAALAELAGDEDFRAAVGAAVERVNRELSGTERVRRFALAPEPFTVENEMMTPTLKIRRHMIQARHGAALDALYG